MLWNHVFADEMTLHGTITIVSFRMFALDNDRVAVDDLNSDFRWLKQMHINTCLEAVIAIKRILSL